MRKNLLKLGLLSIISILLGGCYVAPAPGVYYSPGYYYYEGRYYPDNNYYYPNRYMPPYPPVYYWSPRWHVYYMHGYR